MSDLAGDTLVAPESTVVWLGSGTGMQNLLLAEAIQQHTGYVCRPCGEIAQACHSGRCGERCLVLLDMDAPQIDKHAWLDSLQQLCSKYCVMLFNATIGDGSEGLVLRYPQVRGVLFQNTNMEQLGLSINRVLAGDYWLPREWLISISKGAVPCGSWRRKAPAIRRWKNS